MDDTPLEVVASFANSFDARLSAAHLESAGIECTVATDDAGGVLPSMTGLSGGAAVLVRRDDLPMAREILSSDPGPG